ncbi:hypothetical protein B1A_12485, partial [mine drainage metagenome]
LSEGADIHTDNDIALRCSAEIGQLEVVKFLVSEGADIHAYNDDAFTIGKDQQTSRCGRILTIKECYCSCVLKRQKRQ